MKRLKSGSTKTHTKLHKESSGRVHSAGRATALIGAKIVVASASRFLMAPPGKVALDNLGDPDWKGQLKEFLRAYGRTGSRSFARKASEETLRNRTDVLYSSFTLIMKDKHLQTLADIKPRHMPRMLELWEQVGVGARARINYFTNVRWFWRVCGIEIPGIGHYAKFDGEYTLNRNATTPKSWSANGVNFDEIYQKMLALDPIAANLLAAQEKFGLRLKESLRLRPNEADGRDRLNITEGTKTGRARQLKFEDFDDAGFREVLDDLKGKVDPDMHLAWSHRTLKQAKQHMYTLARKIGLTKKELGVTFHGLRHDFAIRHFESLTNTIAPVRGGAPINYKLLSDARQKITEAMGHNRMKITGAYYGSFRSQTNEQLRHFGSNWKLLESSMPDVWKLMKGQGVENLYWIGVLSTGGRLSSNASFELMLPKGVTAEQALFLAPQIAEVIMGATGRDAQVVQWESLPGAKQVLWSTEAIPLFAPVGPLEQMKERITEQRMASRKPKISNTEALSDVDSLAS